MRGWGYDKEWDDIWEPVFCLELVMASHRSFQPRLLGLCHGAANMNLVIPTVRHGRSALPLCGGLELPALLGFRHKKQTPETSLLRGLLL